MTKQKTAARKRTVTLTIGPLTWAMLTGVAEKINAQQIYGRVGPTDVAGTWLSMSAQRGCDSFGVTVPPEWSHLFD